MICFLTQYFFKILTPSPLTHIFAAGMLHQDVSNMLHLSNLLSHEECKRYCACIKITQKMPDGRKTYLFLRDPVIIYLHVVLLN